jgi:hypothetical protein
VEYLDPGTRHVLDMLQVPEEVKAGASFFVLLTEDVSG